MAKTKTGDATAADGSAHDYFVVVDAGSHGSRVYVYRWLNPQHALEKGLDLPAQPAVSLVRRIDGPGVGGRKRARAGMDKFGRASETQVGPKEEGFNSDSDSDSDSDADADAGTATVLPGIYTGKKWHLKIKPGVASFNESPQKVGKHHMQQLLHLAGKVVPKSEHSRTPFFFHATAGMRLLPPNEQEPIIENICRYVAEESDFYMPDCSSHVNVIDGNVEGLYGWLSINQMIGSFDRPAQHQHGKNHTTYGLLDMGGASTQVVFQPNQTEIDEHINNMYRVTLYSLPRLRNDTDAAHGSVYLPPAAMDANVYSGSYLGFGMFQARARYLKTLLQEFRHANDLASDTFRFRTPVPDPCVPKGYTFGGEIDDHNVDFTGSSNFNECLESIFPVLANNTYNWDAKKYSGDCKKLSNENAVSSCLLNDLIPSIDFSINHFIGVSGYWDTINNLFESQISLPERDQKPQASLQDRESDGQKMGQQEKYDYNLIYSKTQKLCSSSLNELLEMNLSKKMKQEDLADLCFRSSWILNFLHVGLGFPRFGIDDAEPQDKFKSLELVEKVGGSSFSWTLGRAMLYANDEYTQAYNNFSSQYGGTPLPRPGYVYTASEKYVYGAEAAGVPGRPALGSDAGPYQQYPYEQETSPTPSSWTLKPHRFYGEVVFLVLLSAVLVLMFGKQRRARVVSALRDKWAAVTRYRYSRLDEPIEMGSMHGTSSDARFDIGDA